jgi:hypothetical protein
MQRSTLICAALLAGLAACLSAGAVGASAAVGGEAVRIGAPPPLPQGATVEGAAPEAQDLQLLVALQPRDPAALERFASEVSTPGSAAFRDYVSVPEFARRFGATPAQVATVRSALETRGLDVGAPRRNGLSLPVTATVEEAEEAFGISVQQVRLRSGQIAYRNDRAPAVPAAAAPLVEGVLGLDDVAVSHRQGHSRPASPLDGADGVGGSAGSGVATGGPQPCTDALGLQEEEGGYTADQIASAYQLSGFYGGGNFGAGEKIALLELEPYLPSDIATYQSCYGTDVKITDVNVKGGPGPYEGEDGESSLDIEQLIGLAPEAEIIVYQAPNEGEAEVFAAYVEQNQAKVMSSSWGICEKQSSKAEMAVMDTLLQEAAAQGQSFFVAAGDTGSEDCYDSDKKDKSLSVDTPGAQPFATDVGGTRMEQPGVPPTEYLWNDGPSGGAGGGGVSEHFPMPAYQAEAATGLGVVSQLSTGSTCGFSGLCRQVPDVSANASADTGYVVFSEGEWQVIGGTSAAAPLWAALATLTNASPACHGFAIGFANPAIYRIAGSSYAADFHDITSGRPGGFTTNDMLFGGTEPFPVGPGYDMATGLGTPNGPALAASLCGIAAADTVSVANPGGQTTVAGQPVSLRIAAADSHGDPLSFAATGLPAGLTIDPATGVISGNPAAVGTVTVSVSARDALANSGSAQFTWTVAPANPRLVNAALSGVARGRPKLTFTLAARSEASLRWVAVKLPAGLTLAGSQPQLRKGVAVLGTGGERLPAKVRAQRRTLTVHLAQPRSLARFRIAAPALSATPKLIALAKRQRPHPLRVVLSVGETGRQGTRYPLSLLP